MKAQREDEHSRRPALAQAAACTDPQHPQTTPRAAARKHSAVPPFRWCHNLLCRVTWHSDIRARLPLSQGLSTMYDGPRR
eukprot:2078219-Alexandrium_andersonii.AAC.1